MATRQRLRTPVNFRFTKATRDDLKRLADRLGITQTEAMERAVAALAAEMERQDEDYRQEEG